MNREELLASLQKLKAGYIASVNSLEVMRNWGKVQLEALYATKIGRYKIELLELQIELKALKKKIQLCHQYINRDEIPDFEAIEQGVSGMIHQAYQEINNEKEKVAFGKAVLSNLKSPEDSMELRKIFRNIAKKLHPDVNPNLTEEQKKIWEYFMVAYKSGDLDRLKALEVAYAEELNRSEDMVNQLSEEEILLQTATLTQAIREVEDQIRELENEFPFHLADQIRDDEWVEEQRHLIQKEKEELEAALKEKREIYQLIRETYE